MTFTTLIALNAALGLVLVLAVVAVVRFAHRLDHHDLRLASPFQPLPINVVLTSGEVGELENAA